MNDWMWYKVDKFEYRLKTTSGKTIARLVCVYGNNWCCVFHNYDCNSKHDMLLQDINSPEEAIWQATLWIHKTCNQIANSFHNIRDHLPSIHKLAEEARKTQNE